MLLTSSFQRNVLVFYRPPTSGQFYLNTTTTKDRPTSTVRRKYYRRLSSVWSPTNTPDSAVRLTSTYYRYRLCMNELLRGATTFVELKSKFPQFCILANVFSQPTMVSARPAQTRRTHRRVSFGDNLIATGTARQFA